MLTVGEILQKERKKKNFSLEELEKKTKIRRKNLEAIESNNWQHFPSKTYIIGIIKSYAKFLNLDQEKLVAFFRRQYEQEEEIRFKEKISRSYFTPHTKKLLKFSIFLILLFFSLYFGYQLKIYFTPPKVEIISPKTTKFNRERKIKLVGKTEKEATVFVNGQRVYLNKDNIFELEIPLFEKETLVTIEVIGVNGRKTVIKKVFEKNLF